MTICIELRNNRLIIGIIVTVTKLTLQVVLQKVDWGKNHSFSV